MSLLAPGDRVTAEGYNGTLVEPDEDFISRRPILRKRKMEFWCVRFDGAGPNGDGIGVYHRLGLKLRKLYGKP